MPGARCRERSVTVVGAGGNVGSHLVPHLGRMPGLDRVTLVDCGVYERKDLSGQAILPGEVGRSKARVQAARLRRINPVLAVEAIAARVEEVPLGRLRAGILLAALDTRRARQAVNEASMRLDVPWIDAGVLGAWLLARVTVYLPGPGAPCMECAWDQRDYDLVEEASPCGGAGPDAPPTGAPACLGALAAAMQAIECAKLLAAAGPPPAAGRQVLLDAGHHRHAVTAYAARAGCRLRHGAWDVERLATGPAGLTLEDALRLGAARLGAGPAQVSLRVPGHAFAARHRCSRCGRSRSGLRLRRGKAPACPACRLPMRAAGCDMEESLALKGTSGAAAARPLSRLGLRWGDVFAVADPAAEVYFELGGRPAGEGNG